MKREVPTGLVAALLAVVVAVVVIAGYRYLNPPAKFRGEGGMSRGIASPGGPGRRPGPPTAQVAPVD